ncbi:2341_t:CDS:1, partial [Racocetra fulgida]
NDNQKGPDVRHVDLTNEALNNESDYLMNKLVNDENMDLAEVRNLGKMKQDDV